MPKQKRKQNVIHDAQLTNRLSGEIYKGDIVGEEDIDGKNFWILSVGLRTFKLSKEGFDLKRKRR